MDAVAWHAPDTRWRLMEATMMKGLFELGNAILRVVVATAPERRFEYLLYTVGTHRTHRFTCEETGTSASADWAHD
jgi:hypothetical protein